MATLLLELFSEEIPSRMQRGAAEQLQRLIAGGFEKAGLSAKEVKTFVSPRHLAIQLFGLPTVQPDVTEERKGPKIGAPEQAMKGFLNAVGLKAEQCEQRDGYYFATIHRKGRKVSEVAKEICEAALKEFVWPKSMRWGARGMQWVRPLHAIACLLDKEIIPVQFGHLTAGNTTCGHRFLSPKPFNITAADQYMEQLNKAHVMVDFAARRDWVKLEVNNLAKLHNLTVIDDDSLLNEVTGLIEWPVPLLGTFEKKMLDLPPEVLISEMKVHQRYFALTDKAGKLTNQFIAVANMVTADGGKAVISGNARVLRARLADGEFYWEQDRKKPLTEWAKGLRDVVFHAKVGMMSEKVARIEKLALTIAKQVSYIDADTVKRAAQLCKADLTSGMVGEFPELQGVMGRYYAIAQKEKPEIADAIRDHYKPLGASDTPPESKLAAIIGVADKLDSILSLFAAGEKPTGSKDPFALRRAALGILRTVLQHQWNINLGAFGPEEVTDFFRDRLKTMLKDDGVRHDIIEAAMNVSEKTFNPMAVVERTKALANFTQAKTETLAAIKRTLNILAAEEKKNKGTFAYVVGKMSALKEPAEKNLLAAFEKTERGSLAALDGLTKPINSFFDDIMVNADDAKLREARLSLLAGVRDCALEIADFSKIEG